MDVVRFGLGMRALRRRRGWTQQRLADAVRVSRSVVGRIERGRADRVPLHVLVRVSAALGGTVTVRLLWQGEGLDRLLDSAHADLTDRMLGRLQSLDWEVAPEVSFNVRGERGTIDILAFHRPTGSVLVIEIKSVVPDLQAMLGILDRKARLAPEIARERAGSCAGCPDSSSCRTTERPHDAFSNTRPRLMRRYRPGAWRSAGGWPLPSGGWPECSSCQMHTMRALVTASPDRAEPQEAEHAQDLAYPEPTADKRNDSRTVGRFARTNARTVDI